MQADLHFGKLAGKSSQQAGDDPGREGDEAAKIELACKPAAEIECRQTKLVGMGDQLARLAQQAPARGGQRQALGMMAQEQLNAEAALELGDCRRDRRLRDVQLARRAGDAAGVGRGDEIAEMLEGEQVR